MFICRHLFHPDELRPMKKCQQIVVHPGVSIQDLCAEPIEIFVFKWLSHVLLLPVPEPTWFAGVLKVLDPLIVLNLQALDLF
jgi:hypothetical protein